MEMIGGLDRILYMEAKWTSNCPPWNYLPPVCGLPRGALYLKWVGILLYAPGRGWVWERRELGYDD